MNKIEELRKLMTIDGLELPSEINQRFDQIAKLLFDCFIIEHNGSRYLFKEIEFYYYNKNHKDIITHPRSSKALYWYINDFGGIDLNFESTIDFTTRIDLKKRTKKAFLLNEKASFGGILLRKLMKYLLLVDYQYYTL